MKQKILVIDDDRALCELLRQCLGNEGYEVSCLYSGRDAALYLKNNAEDLVILDVMLPETDGFTVLRQVRSFSSIPVLMLSAKGEEMSKVLGLRTGADDYLTKPFGLSELTARVETLLRRCQTASPVQEEKKLLCFQRLQIDREKCLVTWNDEPVPLTAKEYRLLCFLAENPRRVFTKKQIYSHVWDEDFLYDDNTIMALISRLRKKLEVEAGTPPFIQTVRGIGYKFNGEET